MIGRSAEARIYSEEDVLQANLDWLSKGKIPDKALGEVGWDNWRPRTLHMLPREQVEAHNQAVGLKQSEVVFQAPRRTFGTIRQTIGAVAMDIATLIIK